MAQELLPTILFPANNLDRSGDGTSFAVPAFCHVERTLPQIGTSVFRDVPSLQTPAVTQPNLIGKRQNLHVERTLPRDVERTALPCGANPAPR
jgi:hypothetical protein